MKFDELLRSRRESLGITQEKMAGAIGVETRTVANWESGMAKPGITYWRDIITAYRLRDSEFKDSFFETVCPDPAGTEAVCADNIPDVLFTGYDLNIVKNLIFSPAETELLKTLAIYAPDWLDTYRSDAGWFNRNDAEEVYVKLPYGYASKPDIVDFKNMTKSLKDRVRNKNYLELVNVCILGRSPVMRDLGYTDPVYEFDIRKMPLRYIRDMSKSTGDWDSLTDEAYLMIKKIKNGEDLVFEKDMNVEKYLCDAKPQYFDLAPFFTDAGSGGTYNWHGWEQSLAVHEDITDGAEYFSANDRKLCDGHIEHYSGAKVRVRSLWEYSVLVENRESYVPAGNWISFDYREDDDGQIVSCVASLTDKGERLWQYSLEHPELFEGRL